MNRHYESSLFVLEDIVRIQEHKPVYPVSLNDKTMEERLKKVLDAMKERQLDVLIIYNDLEHGSNFEYLTGFLTRFEEGVLVLHRTGEAFLLLGNENIKMQKYSRIPAALIHVPFFSLPNQPMKDDRSITAYFQEAQIRPGQQVGAVGWKMFTSGIEKNRKIFDIPHYIIEAVQQLAGQENVVNCCDLFIGGDAGVRITNNANEIAHYEYGSSLASDGVAAALDHVEEGITELELGTYLNSEGQRSSVVTIAATGERFINANYYPTDKKVQLGDRMSLTVGYKGGLTSRAGYAVEQEDQLPEQERDYIKKIAAPYFAAITAWLENIRIGMSGDEMCRLIQEVLPQDVYHWELNPGHLIGDEEWMSSPIYPDSREILKSGMLLQTDIIPSMPGYGGAGCESGIALADEALKEQISREYPALYDRFLKRRRYIEEVLQIELSEDVLPMNDTVAYYRPFFMNKALAFKKSRR
ncbi:aminopeptidase P family protein [Clostridium sp. KNHs216]|uniref:M24 family metallopeptidase n=1 Tax=Clostridium sp. KNHs216 TaxID=1550235 RepID=UPI00114F8131|nr:aminopeptidase P family protein [Clostridium sp. KNHs216]TQI66042.1 Xaa-Pro aminopeptidase [Clostridium sp. KNHs216]